EISERTAAHPYPEVHSLYVPRIGGGSDGAYVWAQHHVGFGGEDWDYVLNMKRLDVLRAFVCETAEEFGMDEDQVRHVAMRCEDNSLLVDFEMRRPASLSEADAKNHLRDCRYRGLWALYEAQPVGEERMVTTTHELGFEGGEWGHVLEKRRADMEEVAAAETARALQCERGDVSDVVLDVTPKILIVFVKLRHSSFLQRKTIHDRLTEYPYNDLWDLYEPRQNEEKMIITTHELGFEGEDWDYVVEKRRMDVEEALALGTARALWTAFDDIKSVELDVAPNSLIAFVAVQNLKALERREVQAKLTEYPYNEVWRLYETRHTGGGSSTDATDVDQKGIEDSTIYVWTQHHVGFEGEDWDYVLETKQDDMLFAFVGDTAEEFGMDEDHIRNVEMICENSSLLVDFEMRLPAAQSVAEAKKRLDNCKYSGLWALYEPRPAVEVKMVTTTHEVGFEGGDWDYVLEKRSADAEKAVIIGSAQALQCERGDVSDVVLDVTP
ncbi:mitotubule-associated protein Gb4, partial [Trypanosoma grayi]|uniref:mitotubule-associated protein Gb4 n=1 Tax=Trypanosoma grayi TaxID=71804 RepID=UPI0004F45D9D